MCGSIAPFLFYDMQNENTLIELGFYHYPQWDGEFTRTKHYRKETPDGRIFRAAVIKSNGPQYVSIGEVCTPDGKVKRWKDCCSDGSVNRAITEK